MKNLPTSNQITGIPDPGCKFLTGKTKTKILTFFLFSWYTLLISTMEDSETFCGQSSGDAAHFFSMIFFFTTDLGVWRHVKKTQKRWRNVNKTSRTRREKRQELEPTKEGGSQERIVCMVVPLDQGAWRVWYQIQKWKGVFASASTSLLCLLCFVLINFDRVGQCNATLCFGLINVLLLHQKGEFFKQKTNQKSQKTNECFKRQICVSKHGFYCFWV